MRVQLLCLLLGLCCAARLARAQAYEPGWVVRSNGDTLRGEVENGFWAETPTDIRFRASAASPSQLFKPRQLRALAFAGGRYFRYEALPIDHAAETRHDMLTRGYAPDIRLDSVLSEVLVVGPVSLLRVVQTKATHYFVLAPSQPVLALADRMYYRQNKQGNWAVVDGNNYRNQLALRFADCAAASRAAEQARFTAADLAGVVQAYNEQCSPVRQAGTTWLAQASPRRRVSWQGGLVAGLRVNRFDRVSPEMQFTNECADCRPQPMAGLYMELSQPSRSAAIYGELSVTRFRGQGLRSLHGQAVGPPYYAPFDYTALQSTARIGARYFFPQPHDQQLLLTFTYEMNWLFSPRITSTVVGGSAVLDREYGFPTGTILPGLGFGWRSRRITLLAEGQMYRTTLDDLANHFISPHIALRLGMSYRLGKSRDEAALRSSARP